MMYNINMWSILWLAIGRFIMKVGPTAWFIIAVELQPYVSKNFDGYRKAVVPPMQKTISQPKCVAYFDWAYPA
jgi:hypothetical protein